LDLDDAHSDGQEEECHPLDWCQGFPQQQDGEGGGREVLHLIADLKHYDVEVRRGNKLEVVLQEREIDVSKCRMAPELHSISHILE
jgi:hypothetical protein